jgi:hypothetical protein
MFVTAECPACYHLISIPHQQINLRQRCPSCGREFVPGSEPDGEPKDVSFSDVAVIAEKDLPKDRAAAKVPTDPPTRILVQVWHDPTGDFHGVIQAELNAEGLVLAAPGARAHQLIPNGSDVTHLGSSILAVPYRGKKLQIAVVEPGVDQVSLARDLAAVLRKKRERLFLYEYQLPFSLLLLSSLGLVFPIKFFIDFVADPLLKHHFELSLVWCFFCISLTIFLAVWSRKGTPSVRFRFIASSIALIVCAGLPWVYSKISSVDYQEILALLPAPPIPSDSWREFEDPDKRFRVEMPGVPVLRNEPTQNPANPVTMHVVDLHHSTFIVGHVDIPPDEFHRLSLSDRFDGGREGMLKQTPNSKLISQKNITFEGHTGREYQIGVPRQGRLVVRHIAVENRLYLMIVAGRRFTPETNEVRRMFDSFRLQAAMEH